MKDSEKQPYKSQNEKRLRFGRPENWPPVFTVLCVQLDAETTMNERLFKFILIFIASVFTMFFAVFFVPPILENPDMMDILWAGFVNPYATAYSIDLIACWVVLILFIVFEAKTKSIKHGWVCVLLGLVPGVVVGWSVYLLLRQRQFSAVRCQDA